MKKVGAILVSLLSVVLLIACSQQGASKKSTASSSQTTTSSEVKKTDASSSEVKEKEKKEEKKEVKKMDLEAIANGDYSSIAGICSYDRVYQPDRAKEQHPIRDRRAHRIRRLWRVHQAGTR